MTLEIVHRMPPLTVIGHIDVPDKAAEHDYVNEARAITMVFDDERSERVIGTDNKAPPHVSIYGWGRNVAKHRDNLGFVYFTPLVVRHSRVYTKHGYVRLARGTVYRLDDFEEHWTIDLAPVVCLFAGVFKGPADALATAMLNKGVAALAAGSLAAPRVQPTFRVPMAWECFALVDYGGTALVTIAEARKKRHVIATCACCDKPAVSLDGLFPYHWEHNRCREHLA